MSDQIIDYTNYTDFLKKYYQQKKEQNPSWSYNVWSKQLNLSDPSLLTKIVSGSRHPNKEIRESLSRYFNFSILESSFWNFLIETEKLNLTKNSKQMLLSSLKNQLLNSTGPGEDISVLPEGVKWLHGVILILLNEYEEINLMNIKDYFKGPINMDHLSQAITELVDANILFLDSDSTLKLTTSIHSFYADNTDTPHYQKTQVSTCRSFLDAAIANMFTAETPVGGYLSQNMMISVDPQDIAGLTEDVRKAVLEVLLKYEKKEGERALYNVLLQGYQITKAVQR